MPSKVTIKTRETLERLYTGSLLTRLKQLRACEESFELSDRFGYEAEPDPGVTGFIEFKNTQQWNEAYRDLKKILGGREHVGRIPKASSTFQ